MLKEGKMMKKKGIFTVLIICSLVFVSVISAAPASKQTYPSGKEFYPAVYGTFSELYPNARYTSIDFYNNSYTITGITGYALLVPLTYDLTIKLTGAGVIDISYSNIYMKDSNGRWSSAKAFGLYNYNKAVSDIASKMLEIANDPAAFERAEKAAMADIIFVYTIMEKFTEVAFKDFIARYAKGSVFVLEGPISDVKEYGKEVNGITYKYIVTLNKALIEGDEFYSSITGKTIYCRFYTNRDDVIRLSKTSVVKISAILISAIKGSSGSLILDLASSD
jgi:hypothetical protein